METQVELGKGTANYMIRLDNWLTLRIEICKGNVKQGNSDKSIDFCANNSINDEKIS